MKSQALGKKISEVEVTNISIHGIWILINEQEYFLSYEEFPWFRKAAIAEIHNVELIHKNHLHWPDLDIDLELESLRHLEKYPLKAK